MGSNARIFKQQTAALRYELGEGHSYDFVNGPVPWEMDHDLDELAMGEEQTYAICDPKSASSCIGAMKNIERYIETEGPYDGVMAFSQGASIILGWMINKQREAKWVSSQQCPFKVGIFFSNPWRVYDGNALANDQLVFLNPEDFEGLLDLPTAHIWGSADKACALAQAISTSCVADKRSVFIHERGHEIPAKSDTVILMARVINRAIAQAEPVE
ncbi:uncharacterized protein N7477_009357 [Penicillium maclennaniae]|uniref:uncharacterized protein n=1 Tax=Penicillium maclennaniae TaxID=1343394 RepID=UPI0025412B6B|nr:uncharacterized protein N7477_009357 [Penicillium maclennaniae]KAJ5661741.1 hypothetical protein N7477_009357 [Penicillium maclennaniae]